jgi:TatD DNase family protein
MIIDTHSHVNFNAYKDDSSEVIGRSLSNDIWMINVGSQYTTSKRAVEMAEKHKEGVYAAVGLHPIHLETGSVKIKDDPEEIQFNTKEESFDYDKYKELAKSHKVVAIGEVGFDYYWKPKGTQKKENFKRKQSEALSLQVELAKELDLPIIFHCRMAHEDLTKFLEERKDSNLKGVLHCYTGNWQETEEYLKLGLYFGFNGLIFRFDSEEVIKKLPLDRILLETDCPYLTPPQKEGRNEPLYIKYVAEKIADIRGISEEKLIEETNKNAKKLFNI